ncbi:hypothetical protein F5B22DRAFT_642416 [Xylaria bambusicola]|uniref:uncharacterized protein n=1 Tax=Xylaria bambusicola TaxID=326684 RepID=UPI002007A26A|nr:uncharacterized protein F5B22DRAFT_642416 [Xylaria bambusicola]KAI0525399.1 hypothetical protein F5B22DRAFT_642416 [Xylaria bambusicola]
MARKIKKTRKPRVPTAPITPVTSCLRGVMPTAGLRYQSEKQLMYDVRRDAQVANSLESTGCQMVRRSVAQTLADMFRVASPIVRTAHMKGVDLWDILPLVQREINWARLLPEATFFELFTCLIGARQHWLKNIHSPPRSRESDRFIHEIDAFRRNVGDAPKDANHRREEHTSWILIDAVLFNELAGGLDIDENTEAHVERQDAADLKRSSEGRRTPCGNGATTKPVKPLKRKRAQGAEPRKGAKRQQQDSSSSPKRFSSLRIE